MSEKAKYVMAKTKLQLSRYRLNKKFIWIGTYDYHKIYGI